MWEPGTHPTAHALASWPYALWGWQEGVPTGGVPRALRLGLRAHPPPAARPWGKQSASADGCGCGGTGTGTRHRPLGLPALLDIAQHQLAGACTLESVPGSRTRCSRARRTGAVDPGCLPKGRAAGGGLTPNPKRPSRRREGRLGLGVNPPPAGPLPLFSGRGSTGCGSPAPIPDCTLRLAGVVQCPAGQASQGARAGSPCLYPHSHNLWSADADCLPHGRAPRQPSATRAARAVGLAGERPWGGCLVQSRGESGVRRSPSPGCPSLGQAVGVRCQQAVVAEVRARKPGTSPLACMPFQTLRASGVAAGCSGGLLTPR